ncbi:MAG: hypothetical protein AAF337_14150, partial [Pseudomonadota bacterium]
MKTAVIIMQPFAEEMNRCRRLLALTQSALADRGICSLTLDYLGTGDSEGAFQEATLPSWISDMQCLCDLAAPHGLDQHSKLQLTPARHD